MLVERSVKYYPGGNTMRIPRETNTLTDLLGGHLQSLLSDLHETILFTHYVMREFYFFNVIPLECSALAASFNITIYIQSAQV